MLKLFRKPEEENQFEEHLLKHLDSFYNFAYKLTRNKEEAEDLTQEASLRGFKAYAQFTEGTHFKAWMFTIIRNLYINTYRKKTREPLKVNYEEAENFVDLPEITGFAEELFSEAMQQALNDLPEELSSTLNLFYVEELSYKEIADIMKCPVGTVMSRLFTARQSMKKKLMILAKRGIT